MKKTGRKLFLALVCFGMMCWATVPCFIFGAEIGSVSGTKVGPETVSAGETVEYTIDATVGSTPISFFHVKDVLPNELVYVDCSVSVDTEDGPCDFDKAIAWDEELGANVLTVTIKHDDGYGDWESCVYSGDVIHMTVTAEVKDGVAAGTEIVNVARFTAGSEVIGEAVSNPATVVGDSQGDLPTDPGAEPTVPTTPGETDNSAAGDAEYDDSPKCGDSFLDFWYLIDIIKGKIYF